MEHSNSTKDQWNADLYDSKHSFVSGYGSDLVDLLAPKKGEHILDLGCGTGDLAKKLYDLEVHVVGVDNSQNMVDQAQVKYPNITFLVSDALDLNYNNEFDAVFSNATLHWVKPPARALHCIYNSLKQGGRFVAEFGGKGNVQLITDEIISQIRNVGIEFNTEHFPWYFPSIGEYSSLMEETGFRVAFAQHFDRITPLHGDSGIRDWIEMFGSGMFTGITEEIKEQIITRVEKNLENKLCNKGNWMADYKRIRIVGIKES